MFQDWSQSNRQPIRLTLFAMNDFPIFIDTRDMRLPIVYFKGSKVDFYLIMMHYSLPKGSLLLATSSPLSNDRSPGSQHNVWRHHN